MVKEIIQVAEIVQSNYKDTPLKFNVITLKVDTLTKVHIFQNTN
jgi:hypothetical protein